jgi:acetyltransferase-like isoleucine patch superfamily enzyme
MNNGARFSESGTNGKCRIMVIEKGELRIGNNVGISDVTISCYKSIIIEDHATIGVGTEIRDSDVHAIDPEFRKCFETDGKHKLSLPVVIKENVFIGSKAIILKGVTIGKNAVIAAGSVVTKSIPDNEIWGGNPAKFIKRIEPCLPALSLNGNHEM